MTKLRPVPPREKEKGHRVYIPNPSAAVDMPPLSPLTLDPYQVTGAEWLANGPPVLYLADQMRVGKTPQCVAACDLLEAERVLVICPGIARRGWIKEFGAFSTDKSWVDNSVLIQKATDADSIKKDTRLIVVSYDLAIKDDVFAALFARCMVYGLDVLILDEAHYVTNREAKRTEAILGKTCNGNEALAGLAKRVWFVSGTPERRDPSDLFPFCRMAGLWKPSRSEFIDKFCFGYEDGYEFKITGAKNTPGLARLLKPRMLRRLRSDIADVKVNIGSISVEGRDVTFVHHILRELAAAEPKYADAVKHVIETGDFAGIDLRGVAPARRLVGMAKVPAMMELIRDSLAAEPTRKIVVFGLHRDPLKMMHDYMKREKADLIYGGTPDAKRDFFIDRFHSSRQHNVLLCNMTAASTAIDLSCADLVYIFEPSWIPVDNAQALSRVLKLRDPDRVKDVVFVGLADSIDDAVTRVCERRTKDISDLLRQV